MSNREISRTLGMDRKTIRRYIHLADNDPLGLDRLLKLDGPVLERLYTGGHAAYSGKRFRDLSGRLEYIVKELHKTGVTLYLLGRVQEGLPQRLQLHAVLLSCRAASESAPSFVCADRES